MDTQATLPPLPPEPPGPEPSAPQPPQKQPSLLLLFLGLIYLACLGLATVMLWTGGPVPDIRKTKAGLLGLDLGQEAVGILRIDGIISMQRQGFFFSGNLPERIAKQMERLMKKSNVKAVILKINSPGGTAAASQAVYNSLRRLRSKYRKPVIALMGDVAASGGYYIASACDEIVAEPGTLTGSIGVIFQTMHIYELARRWGVEFNTIKSGKFKDIGNFARSMSPEEKYILQELIDTAYRQFVTAVSQGRKMPEEEVRLLADGRIFTGEQAKRYGLIDSVGGFTDALARAKKLGNIKGEPKIVEESQFKESLILELLEGAQQKLWFAWRPPTGLLYLWPGI